MNKMPSHTHISIFILILGMLYLEGCSLYHNYIWYEPRLLNENDEVVIPEKDDYEIWRYYTKTTANAWLIFFFPFIPLGEDFDGPHPYCHKGDLVIWVKKQEECPVVYVDNNPVYGKIREDEPDDITGKNKTHDLCHYGKLPIEQQQIYTIKYKGEMRRYLFKKEQNKGYTPFWFPSA